MDAGTTYTIGVEARDAAGNESNDGPERMSTTDAAATTHFVVTVGNTFSPNAVNVSTGDTVQWDNTGGGLHNVVWDGGEFPGSGSPSSSAWTYSEIFDTAGVYTYHCEIHVGLGMTGTVTVTDP